MSLLVNKNGDAIQVDHNGKLIVWPIINGEELRELEAAREVIKAVKDSLYRLDCLTNSLTGRHIDGCETCALIEALRKYDEAVK